ncbi:MAG: hypothetical protein POELPBGB_00179 [Bacteroidia bacterium]|nr:hypothetical protein [Bacteroidia bacterium]
MKMKNVVAAFLLVLAFEVRGQETYTLNLNIQPDTSNTKYPFNYSAKIMGTDGSAFDTDLSNYETKFKLYCSVGYSVIVSSPYYAATTFKLPEQCNKCVDTVKTCDLIRKFPNRFYKN